MRASVITTFALAVALVPAAAFAQATTAQQPPAAQKPPAAAAPAPTEPKVPFTTPAGILLVQIKPDKTADLRRDGRQVEGRFCEDGRTRLSRSRRPASRSTRRPSRSAQHALCRVAQSPTAPNSEDQLFNMLSTTMSPDEKRDPGCRTCGNGTPPRSPQDSTS